MAIELRPALLADAPEVARVHVRAWQVGYRGLIPADFLDGISIEDRAKRYTFEDPDPAKPYTIVAADGSRICGFVTIGPANPETAGAGHLMALYVDPDRWSQGIGRMLIERGRTELALRGYPEAVLWVLDGNLRGDRFYTADGWVADGHVEQDDVWGLVVTNRRYRRKL